MTVQTLSSSTNSATPLPTSPLDKIKEAKQNKALATFVLDEYQRCKSARTSVERTWYKNLAFYSGNQWVTWVAEAKKLTTPKAPPWRTRLTVNRIRPIIRTELARVTSQKPNASVVPASSEDEDLFAAQAGEQVWESVYNRKQIHRIFSRSAWWMLITGVGFLKTYWDEEAVDRVSNLKGDICVENVTPFHIFVPDLVEPELENQQYVIHAFTRPVAEAKRYLAQVLPDKAEKIEPNVASSSEIMDDAMLRVGANNKPDSVLFIEMWLKPGAHPDFPNGGMIQVVDKWVVRKYTDGIPYKHGEFPFIKFEHVPTGKFYSDSVIIDLIDLQREYNRTRSQIIEAKNRMAKPQLRAAQGSIDPGKITSEPGIVIEYKPGFDRPEPMPLQPLPAYVLQELDRIIMDMEDISAQHQVSKGQAPAGVTAATAISYLQERDDSVLTHTYESVEQGMEKLARHILSHAVEFWDVPRTVKVTGTDGAFDALALKGSDLKNGTDIRMEAGSALPTSKAARQAFIMDMMKMGFIPPDQGLRIMEIGGVQKLYDQLQVDERQAQRENLRMKMLDPMQIQQYYQSKQQYSMLQAQAQQQQSVIPPQMQDIMGAPTQDPNANMPFAGGEQPVGDPSQVDTQTGMPLEPPTLVPVNTWDNHAVHIEVHNRFRKSQAFEMLSQDHKDLFEEHVQLHAMALNQSATNAGMQGMPGGDMGGMGVPPMSQSEGGTPPEMAQQGAPPNG